MQLAVDFGLAFESLSFVETQSLKRFFLLVSVVELLPTPQVISLTSLLLVPIRVLAFLTSLYYAPHVAGKSRVSLAKAIATTFSIVH